MSFTRPLNPMKHHLTRIIAAVCIALGTLSSLSAAENQPRMEKAVELLQEAKKSPAPIGLLEKAKDHLQNATGNKGGNKVEAVKTINQAIKIAKQGGKPDKEISRAIAMVKSGIREAK